MDPARGHTLVEPVLVRVPRPVMRAEHGVKAQRGYEGYSKGDNEGPFSCAQDTDCPLNQAFFTQVIAKLH